MLSLATSPATPRQRTQAIAAGVILCAGWPVASLAAQGTWLGPDLSWALLVAQLMTAYLLFSQLFQERSPAIALIAAAYLFTVIFYNVPIFWLSAKLVHPESLLQSARAHAWLGVFAHAGFPLFFLAYAVFDSYLEHIKLSVRRAVALAVGLSVAVFVLVLLLGVIAIAFDAQLAGLAGLAGNKPFAVPGIGLTLLAIALVSLVAFVAATRLHTLTHNLLALALLAATLDIAMLWLVHGSRFTAGWSIAQFYGLLACIAIPSLYVFEFQYIYDRLHAISEVVRHQALVDEVSGVANKRQFDLAIDLEWRRSMRTGAAVSLIFLEVDELEACALAAGQAAADALVRKVGEALRRRLRRAGDVVARIDDACFALILPDIQAGAAIDFAAVLAAEIGHRAIAHPANPPKGVVTVTTAATTTVPALGRPVSEFVDAARAALGAAGARRSATPA